MRLQAVVLSSLSATLLLSCVSSSTYKALQQHSNGTDTLYARSQNNLKDCQDVNASLIRQKNAMQDQLDLTNKQLNLTKDNNTQLLKQLQDLSVISNAQAESISKSMDNIGAKDRYIQEFRAALAHRDSVNLALIMNFKGEIGNQSEQDINIKIDKGIEHIDIADQLLFDSTGFTITDKGKALLGKLALVLTSQPDISFTVEGNTDSIPFSQGELLDNWDLSVKRATSVVRTLQGQYNIPPAQMTAAGHSEYQPVGPNDVPEGRAANRRTRIIILPQLDAFFQLLDRKGA